MRNIQLIIEYDGTNYCGWQVQNNGISVQEKICQSIEQAIGKRIPLIGAGRTDAGVHALGQSANFMTETRIPISRIPFALNRNLPRDIRIVNAIERELDFHSRYSAIGKVYQYKILNNLHGTALHWNKVLHIKESLDVDAMKVAASFFIGTYDFTGFSSAGSSVKDKVRTITRSELQAVDNCITYAVCGTGFLYNMVRIIVGTLIKVGQGKIKAESIPAIIDSKKRNNAGPTAAASGLYLKEVLYESNLLGSLFHEN